MEYIAFVITMFMYISIVVNSCSKHLSNSAGVDGSDVGSALGTAGCGGDYFMQHHNWHERCIMVFTVAACINKIVYV